jgi:hypothetical protein
MAVVQVEHNIGDFRRWLDRIGERQLPFATALALTRTAQDVQRELRHNLDRHFIVRRNWISRGIQVEAASKRHTLKRMAARVGSLDAFMLRQEMGGEKRGKAGKDVAIPLGIRRTPKQTTPPNRWPKALLQRGGKRKFFVRTIASGPNKGKKAVLRRKGKAQYPLQVLYLFKPEVHVPAHWDLRATAGRVAPRAFPFEMRQALDRAIRSAR